MASLGVRAGHIEPAFAGCHRDNGSTGGVANLAAPPVLRGHFMRHDNPGRPAIVGPERIVIEPFKW